MTLDTDVSRRRNVRRDGLADGASGAEAVAICEAARGRTLNSLADALYRRRHIIKGRMADAKAGGAGTSPIAKALGGDFHCLHPAVRRHYAEPTIHVSGTMDFIYVKSSIMPLAHVSHRLFHAPVPHGGIDVEVSVHNWVDDAGAMHWVRMFFKNASFPKDVTFKSRMVYSGDHTIIEFTRFGLGVESTLSVDVEGSLVHDIRKYVVRMPLLGLILRFPTWLTPFGGGCTQEIGETEDSFRVEFEMTHLIFGRTVAYTGRCGFVSR